MKSQSRPGSAALGHEGRKRTRRNIPIGAIATTKGEPATEAIPCRYKHQERSHSSILCSLLDVDPRRRLFCDTVMVGDFRPNEDGRNSVLMSGQYVSTGYEVM